VGCLTDTDVDKAIFICSNLGPHTRLADIPCKTRGEFKACVVRESKASGRINLLEGSLANLSAVADSLGWAKAAAQPYPPGTPNYMLKRNTLNHQVLVGRDQEREITVAMEYHVPPKLCYNTQGYYELVSSQHRLKCDDIFAQPDLLQGPSPKQAHAHAEIHAHAHAAPGWMHHD